MRRLPPGPARPPLTLDDMTHAGFVLLAEEFGTEIVFGQISRPWKASAPTGGTPALRPEEFAEFGPEESAPIPKKYVGIASATRRYFHAGPNFPVEDFVAEAPGHPVFRLVA